MDVINPMPLEKNKRIGRAPKYTDDYYLLMAKQVVENGLSYQEAAEKYKCSHGTVAHWTKLYRGGKLLKRVEKQRVDTSKHEQKIQRQERYIKELKAQIGELYLENQLLKKAQNHFHQVKNETLLRLISESSDRSQEDAE